MAAPLRNLGLKLLRNQQKFLMYPMAVKTMGHTYRAQGVSELPVQLDGITSIFSRFVSKRGLYHSTGFPPRAPKCPLYRTVHTTKCSLSNCLTSSCQVSRMVKSHRFVAQKLSTGTGTFSGQIKEPPQRFDRAILWLGSYADKFVSKLWKAFCERIETEIISWVWGVGGLVIVLLVTAAYKALGIEVTPSTRVESQENKDVIKGLSDLLECKDKRYAALESDNEGLRKENRDCTTALEALKALAKSTKESDNEGLRKENKECRAALEAFKALAKSTKKD